MDSLNIFFTGKDQVEVQREPVPELKAGQVLVETQRSLISTGTECICLQRNFAPGTHWDNWVTYPFYPGYSNAGRVVQVADDVQDVQPGDRVATRSGHKQYFVTGAAHVRQIPEGVSDEDATWFGLANIVQIGVRRAEHELGDAVVIIGAGLLGQLALQYTRLSGAREVIVIDTAQPRLEMAHAHGATKTLAMSVADAREAILQETNGRLADVVYDITGHAAVFPSALGLARRFGKLLLLGDTGTPSEQRLTSDVISRGVRIAAAHDGHPPAVSTDREWWTHEHMTQLFFTYLQRQQMRVSDLVTHRYAPQDAAQAYHMLITDRSAAMGVIFDWSRVK
ncbi:MAG: zinc-binding dehydrogenase [Abitibacteriaceae bacterium]|nr:zinc-binding dehydrogenase [Abditibacteriaceae bacterium]MBV9866959.1 zinc-binding dehydrogenase [Abditibacteriaceae bacterium]